MDLFYGVADTGTIARAGYGWLDGATAVTLRVQPRAIAPGGLAQQHALGPAHLVVRRNGACRVTVTPVIDGVVRSDVAAEYEFGATTAAALADQVLRRALMYGTGFSQQVLRGTFGSVRAELTPLEVATIDPAGAENALTFQATALAGDAITVEYVDPAANNEPLAVAVVGTAITVTLATDGLGVITSTAAQVKAAIEAEVDADALVTVSIAADGPLGTGAGVVTAMAVVTLVAGTLYALGGFELGARAVGVGGARMATVAP